VPNITLENGLETEKFSFQMTPEEKQERRAFYGEQFQKMTEKAVKEQYDLLFLDETIYTITAGLLDEELVLKFLREKPENLEVILTGNTPSPQLLELADYVSEIKKVKHPFDTGQRARKGIEK
jgi:cob(I)alamin adenosyltransferase